MQYHLKEKLLWNKWCSKRVEQLFNDRIQEHLPTLPHTSLPVSQPVSTYCKQDKQQNLNRISLSLILT